MADRERNGEGPGGMCVCPKCGARVRHESGVPCTEVACECGAAMVREGARMRAPLPKYLLDRLEAGEPAVVLAAVDLNEHVGHQFELINERLNKSDEVASFGVVEIAGGKQYQSAHHALMECGQAVDGVTAREYAGRNPEPTFAYALKLVERFEEPRSVDAGRRIPGVKDEVEKWIFSSPAGKARKAKLLANALPSHQAYVEPFCGSAAVLFAKEPCEREVINDADKEIAQAFRDIKSLTSIELASLKRKNWVGNKKTYLKIKSSEPKSKVDRLYRFLYITRFSMSKNRRAGFDTTFSGLTARIAERVERFKDRLSNVKIHDGDWEGVVSKYDNPNTVFYFDPPYSGYDAGVGEKKFDEKRFFDALKKLDGKFILTYGERGELPKMIRDSGFKSTRVQWARAIGRVFGAGGSDTLKTLIATNFDIDFSILRKADDDIAFVATLPDALGAMDAAQLKETGERLADIWDNRFGDGEDEPDGLVREEVLAAAIAYMEALGGMYRTDRDRYLFEAVAEIVTQKQDHAPVHPGSEGAHEPLALADAVAHVKPIVLRREAVALVGSLPQWKSTRGDVDLLIKGPLDEATRQAIQFRVGRQFPPEISKRLQFLDDDMGGPFTTHVPLYNLELVPTTHEVVPRDGAEFARIEMAAVPVDKQDPYLTWPANPNRPVRSVMHMEFIGEGFHFDWRIAVRANQLIGWTITAMKAGAIRDDVTSVSEARGYASGLTLEGNRVTKPLVVTEGRGLLAIQKRPPPPIAWLEVDQRAWDEETKEGKTRHVMIAVDRPMVQWGRTEPTFHEYFLTRGQRFNGTVAARQVVGEGGDGEEAGRRTPEGQVFWRFFVAKKPLPSVLRRRSVRLKRMPPDGAAAIPRDLMALVPSEYRYWEKKGAAAREVRDALVESKFFTENNVVVVGGRYRRVEERKKFYSVPQPPIEKAGAVTGEYRFVWQYWKRRAATERAAPSRQVWHLLARIGGKRYAWTFPTDPLTSEKASGTSGAHSDADWKREGEIEPGAGGLIGNDTKATPSWAVVRESGKAALDEAADEKGSLMLQLETSDGPVVLALRPEEEGAKIWISERRKIKQATLADLPDCALVAFRKTGPVALECGCGHREFQRMDETIQCAKCGSTADAEGCERYRWELEMDIGALDVVVATEGIAEPEQPPAEPPAEHKRASTHVVPIGKGEEFQGYFKDVVLKPNDGIDGPLEPDTQQDGYSAAAIDHAMRWNAEHAEQDNIQHGEHEATGDWAFIIVQNYLADVDFWLGPNGETAKEPGDWRDGLLEPPGQDYRFIPKGSWIREGRATGPELRKGLETGEFNAWSIEGFATRVPETVQVQRRATA